MMAASSCIEKNDTQVLLKQLSDDYSRYLTIDFGKQRKCLDESIEEMLLKLDEFVGLIDMVRSDDTQCLKRTLPNIHSKCQELEKVFEKIDKLEAFVKKVRENVDKMEEKVALAERELRPENSFYKAIKPFFMKKSSGAMKKSPSYEAPKIFKTSDYLTSPTSETITLCHEGDEILQES